MDLHCAVLPLKSFQSAAASEMVSAAGRDTGRRHTAAAVTFDLCRVAALAGCQLC